MNGFHRRQAPKALVPTGEHALRRAQNAVPALLQRLKVAAGGGMIEHLAIHRRGQQNRGTGGQIKVAEEVWRQSLGKGRQGVGRGRHHRQQIGRIRQLNVSGLPPVLLPQVNAYRLPTQGLQGDRGNQSGRRLRHHNMHRGPVPHQEAGEVRGLVGRNRSGHPQYNGPPLQWSCRPCFNTPLPNRFSIHLSLMIAPPLRSKEKAPPPGTSPSLTEKAGCLNLTATAMQKGTITKYASYPPVSLKDRTWPDRQLTQAPIWCSVDLRDGNQALPIPMTVDEKTELFLHLVDIGFKEIEVGFPSASETEFRFLRKLIEENLIPDDVTVQCLVQCRDHLIEKTFEAIDGAPSAIVHFYNSTNPLQRRVTFNLSKEEILAIAVNGATQCRRWLGKSRCGRVRFEYSPESFSDTELPFSLEVCEAVIRVLEPTVENKLILNLPATVELFTPNVHADQIEWFCRHLSCRDKVLISLHTHNDRGTGIAATELGLMAGADRVEGTLFGNGERTGNLDIVTVALNLYTQGVDPGLDFSNLPLTREIYERTTRMSVHERHPYAGDLVFTAFSGSHQDAIKKGMDARRQSDTERWEVPYLPIDCEDIGRTYQAIIRINSQSGKGGVAYILERSHGIQMPKAMHPEFGQVVTALADSESAELTSLQIWEAFESEYLRRSAPLCLLDYEIDHKPEDVHRVHIEAQIAYMGEKRTLNGRGNGPIAAFVNALANGGLKAFSLSNYAQHSISKGSAANAVSFVRIERESDDRSFWGASIDSNVENGGLLALVSAINRASE